MKSLNTFGILTISALLFAAPHSFGMQDDSHGKKNLEVQLDLAIAKYQGMSKGAVLHAQALTARAARVKLLMEKNIISKQEYRQVLKKSQLATLKAAENALNLESARLDKAIFKNDGKDSKDLFGKVWTNRQALAENALAAAKVEAEYYQWFSDAMHKLAANGAMDPSTLPEIAAENQAYIELVAGKEAELKLLKQTPPPSFE